MDVRNSVSRLSFEEIESGMVFETSHRFSVDDVNDFARLSGDFSPLHVDSEYASGTEFGNRVVHGMLLASLFSRLVGMKIPGESALYLGQDIAFRHPVAIGERVTAIVKVASKNSGTRSIQLGTEIRNEQNKIVVSGSAKVKVRGAVEVAPTADGTPVDEPHSVGKRLVLVTGGSKGIGAGICRLLGSQQYSVAVNYHRSAAHADEVANDIRSGGGSAISVKADVRVRDEVDAMIAAIVDEYGRIDCVVNGAVGELLTRQFLDLSWQEFREHLDYQLKAVLNVCQSSFRHLAVGRMPAVVNILSQVVDGVPPVHMADYVSAKYALKGLSRALAAEWARNCIRVNTISPGLVQTDLTQHYQERVFKMESARTPLKRLASIDDIAGSAAFLLSEQAAFVTGMDMSLTGGQVMK